MDEIKELQKDVSKILTDLEHVDFKLLNAYNGSEDNDSKIRFMRLKVHEAMNSLTKRVA